MYNNDFDNEDIPLGLGMALAQNIPAMEYFASLGKSGQKSIIEQAHNINSKQEMKAFVNSLAYHDNNY